ncbi:Fc.00g006950.m01.CDS01 [Cosmosporella sp. VM-42]
MSSPTPKNGREDTAPFLLQLFYKTGGFHRPDEFAYNSLPPSIAVYTWSDCTLNELALELAAADSTILPSPAIGTRLVFQLVFPDLRNASAMSNGPPRFAVKDLGTVVIGEGGPGAETGEDVGMEKSILKCDKDKTLSEARFVVGDYVSCAVLPPLLDGSVALASSVRRETAGGVREGRGGFRGGFSGRENGSGRGGGRGGRGGWRDGPGGNGFPMGDWRRGERLPDGSGGGRPRGRGRW